MTTLKLTTWIPVITLAAAPAVAGPGAITLNTADPPPWGETAPEPESEPAGPPGLGQPVAHSNNTQNINDKTPPQGPPPITPDAGDAPEAAESQPWLPDPGDGPLLPGALLDPAAALWQLPPISTGSISSNLTVPPRAALPPAPRAPIAGGGTVPAPGALALLALGLAALNPRRRRAKTLRGLMTPGVPAP